MKIALVSQEFPPETAKGGIGTQTLTKAQGLSSLGHTVFVISRSIDVNRHEKFTSGFTVIRIPGFENYMEDMTSTVQWLTYSTLVAAELESLNHKIELDVIDFPEWAAESYVYLLNRTSWKNVTTVIQLHGPLVMFGHTVDWPKKSSTFYKIGTHMEATCIQLADAVYSSSICSAEWIRNYYDPTRREIPVIHTGVDTSKFYPVVRSENDHPTILFSGKIVANKGVYELVEAACRLRAHFPNLQLQLLGKGDQEFIDAIIKKATEYGAAQMLKIAGFKNKNELPQILNTANVFAAPSYYEGGPGFVYLEAMACGIPVIGCTGSGVDEIISSGENGMLVPPQDVESLMDALYTILSSKEVQVKMGGMARTFVLKHADSTKCIIKLEAFYKKVIDGKFARKEVCEYE